MGRIINCHGNLIKFALNKSSVLYITQNIILHDIQQREGVVYYYGPFLYQEFSYHFLISLALLTPCIFYPNNKGSYFSS